MTLQDRRAVESMCHSDLELDMLVGCFPMFARSEVEEIFNAVQRMRNSVVEVPVISLNILDF